MRKFKILLLVVINLFLLLPLLAAETLSYSGRLVQTNGSPVLGPVTLKAEIAYTNALTTVLCSEEIPNVTLTKGVFHIGLDLNCSASGLTLTQVLSQVPNGESVAIQITDVTNSKSYNYQVLHAIPFANVASQLVQMGATNGQILKWNNGTKKWAPAISNDGTVTNVSGILPISVENGASAPVISISQANPITSGYLSSTDWNTFNNKQSALPGGGNSSHYYRGDNTWKTLNTDAVPEGEKLYFENVRVLLAPLTGFFPGSGVIAETDSVLQAFSKTQGQINTLSNDTVHFLLKDSADTISSNITLSGSINSTLTGDITVRDVPLGLTSAVNKNYVDTENALRVSKSGDAISGTLTLNGDIKIKGTGGTTNYVILKGSPVTTDYTLVLPPTAGPAGHVLQTDGTGVLSWVNPSSTVTGTGTVNSISITDGAIVDADINASAGIAQSKIANLSTDLAGKQPLISVGTTAQYYRGDKTFVDLSTDVRVVTLTGYAVGSNSSIAATDTMIGAFQKLQGQIDSTNLEVSNKEPALSAGTSSKYYRGDKTWQTLHTNAVAEGTNLYFTDERARLALTASLALKQNIFTIDGTLDLSNSILGVKNQGLTQIKFSGITSNCSAGQVLKTNVDGSFSCANDNDTAATAGNWASDGTNVYRATGKVGIGTASPTKELEVNGVVKANAFASGTATFTLPNVAGSNGQVLQTNGTGSLSWTSMPTVTVTSVNTKTGAVVLNTDDVTEGSTNKYYTDAKVLTAVTATLANKQDLIATGTTAQYYRGDKTWQTLNTTAVAEGTNLYFTNARAQAALTASLAQKQDTLTASLPLSIASNIITLATNSITNSYLQGAPLCLAGEYLTYKLPGGFSCTTEVASGNGVWTASGGNVYRESGNVGIGTATPSQKLSVAGIVESTSGGFKFPDGTTMTTAVTAAPVISVNTKTGAVVLNTDDVTEGSTNKYYTDAKVLTAVTATLANKQDLIAAGTTAQYYRGDKTWQTLNTTAVAEGTNLYFTNARAQAALTASLAQKQDTLTASLPLSIASNTISLATNSISGAYLWGNTNCLSTEYLTYDAIIGFRCLPVTPAGVGTWSSDGTNVWKSSGKVGIGTASPTKELEVNGVVKANAFASGTATFTLPNAAGSNGQVLQTNGSGTLSWVNQPTAPVNSVNGATGAVVLTTTNIAEGTNLYYTDARVLTAVTASLSAKENTITSSATAAYYRGDKSWQTLNTTVVPEGSNLYFTTARAQAALTASLSAKQDTMTASLPLVLAGNEIRLPNQSLYDIKLAGIASSCANGEVVKTNGLGSFYCGTDNDSAAGMGAWTASETDVYRAGGKVGIGTTNPGVALDVSGDGHFSSSIRVGSNLSAFANRFYAMGTLTAGNGTTFTAANKSEAIYIGNNDSSLQRPFSVYKGSYGAGSVVFGTTGVGIEYNISNAGTTKHLVAATDAIMTNTNSGDFIISTENNGSLTEKLRIMSSGNIGIGTATPSQKLSVAGIVESTSGGFKFPDGTTMTTAVTAAPVISVNTKTGAVVLNTDDVAEGSTNKYYTDTKVLTAVTATLANKQDLIAAGTTAQYYRGDKTWQTLNTTAVTEGTNLYFTNARAQAALTASLAQKQDTLTASLPLTLVGNEIRLSNQSLYDVKLAGISSSCANGEVIKTNGLGSFYCGTDSDSAAGMGTWSASATDVYRLSGKVGIGTTSPGSKLEVASGNISITTSGTYNGPLGSNSFPTYSFNGDANTGFYSPGADLLSFVTGGSDRIRINASGNVGIGTTSPLAKLDVVGEIRAEGTTAGYVGFKAAASTSSQTYTWPTGDGSNGQVLQTNGAGILSWVALPSVPVSSVFGRTGSVVATNGDYTATQVTNTPSGAIAATTVQGAVNELDSEKQNTSSLGSDVRAILLTGLSLATNAVISATDSILSAFGKLQAQVTALDSGKLDKTGGTLTIGTINGVPTPTLADQVVNKGYVDSFGQWTLNSGDIYRPSGKVGIGTTTPGATLDVKGAIRLSGATSGYSGIQPAANAGSTVWTLPTADGAANQVLATNGSGGLSWVTPAAGSDLTPSLQTADFTINNSHLNYLFLVNPSGGAATATLPLLTSVSAGFRVLIKRTGFGFVNVAAASGDTIEGSSLVRTIDYQGGIMELVATTAGWELLRASSTVNSSSLCIEGNMTFSAGGESTITITPNMVSYCKFSVSIRGAGGGNFSSGSVLGGSGGGVSFNWVPTATGTLGVFVGGAGLSSGNGGTGGGGTGYGSGASGAGGGGGASAAIYINPSSVITLLAIAGGAGGGAQGGAGGDGGGGGSPGANGGGGYGGQAGGNNTGGAAVGASGAGGSSIGNGGAGYTVGGVKVPNYSISGGGGGAGVINTSGQVGAGGGAGYGGGSGGAGSSTSSSGGAGGGGGGYVNTSKVTDVQSIAGAAAQTDGSAIVVWTAR